MLKNIETFISEELIRQYLRSSLNFDASVILPHCQNAAETYLYKLISREFLAQIIAGEVTDEYVVDYTRSALVYFAGVSYADFGLININNAGIMEHGDDNSKPVRLEVLANYRKACLKSAHAKVELLMEYLEKNVQRDGFEKWKKSSAYTLLENSPIKSLDDFQSFLFLHHSRIAFVALKSYITRAYEVDLLQVREVIDSLALTPVQQNTTKNYLKHIVCNLAYAYGISDFATILEESVYQFDNRGANKQSSSYVSAQASVIEAQKKEKLATANRFQEKLESLIQQWKGEDEVVPFENSQDQKVFFVG